MCRFAAIGYHYMYDMRGCTFRKFEDSIHSKAVTRAAQPHVKPNQKEKKEKTNVNPCKAMVFCRFGRC